jgi:hypothetical protein
MDVSTPSGKRGIFGWSEASWPRFPAGGFRDRQAPV